VITIPNLQKKRDFPMFYPGDTIRVMVKIHEGDVERLQPFEGIVIRKHGGGYDETFTVRKVSFGVGIERIFSMFAPNIEKIELVKKGVVRRAKLYYLRNLTGKASKIDDEQAKDVSKETSKDTPKDAAKAAAKSESKDTPKDAPKDTPKDAAKAAEPAVKA